MCGTINSGSSLSLWFWSALLLSSPVPGFRSSSRFSLSGGTRLKGSTAGSWSVWLAVLVVPPWLAKGTLPVLLLEPAYKGPAAISLTPFSCAVVFHSPLQSSAVHGAAPPLLPLAMVLNWQLAPEDSTLLVLPVPASCPGVGVDSPFSWSLEPRQGCRTIYSWDYLISQSFCSSEMHKILQIWVRNFR